MKNIQHIGKHLHTALAVGIISVLMLAHGVVIAQNRQETSLEFGDNPSFAEAGLEIKML